MYTKNKPTYTSKKAYIMSTNKARTHGKKAYTPSRNTGFTNIKINIEGIFHYVSPDFLILIHFLYKVGVLFFDIDDFSIQSATNDVFSCYFEHYEKSDC